MPIPTLHKLTIPATETDAEKVVIVTPAWNCMEIPCGGRVGILGGIEYYTAETIPRSKLSLSSCGEPMAVPPSP
jgi:hypothetical protein